MLLVGGAQVGLGALLIGRLGYLGISQNDHYRLLAEDNRVQLIPVPPRRGWIIDRHGKPIAINRSSFRVDIIPQQLVDGPRVIREVANILELPADELQRIADELKSSRGFQPVSVAENVPYEKYAAIMTVEAVCGEFIRLHAQARNKSWREAERILGLAPSKFLSNVATLMDSALLMRLSPRSNLLVNRI